MDAVLPVRIFITFSSSFTEAEPPVTGRGQGLGYLLQKGLWRGRAEAFLWKADLGRGVYLR